MITVYAAFNSLLFFSVMLAMIVLLRCHTRILGRWSVSILLLMSVLAGLRLVLPVDLHSARVVHSWTILPAVLDFFDTHPAARRLLLAVWGVGAAVVVARDLYLILRAHLESRDYIVIYDERVEQVVERLGVPCPVVVSPDVEIPYVAGFFRHTIYLPAAEMTQKEIEAVLRHETQHVQGHDAQIKLLFGLISAALWWVPFVYPFRGELDALLELRCDENATRRMDQAGQVAYMQVLLDMAKRMVDKQPALAVDRTQIIGKRPNMIEKRFKRLNSNIDKPPRRMGIAVLCCMVALFLCSYLIIIQPGGDPPAADFYNAAEVDCYDGYDDITTNREEGTFILKRLDGRYELFVDYVKYKELSFAELSSERYVEIAIYEEVERQ